MKRKHVQAAVVMFFLGAAVGHALYRSLWITFATAAPLLMGLAILGYVGRKVMRHFRRF